jgi:2-desacetyl-2-hydroxyethyl bacteriochlorophyllide A dehydrogenase
MKRLSLFFKQPFVTELRERSLPVPTEDQLLVATRLSAISAGTEMLVFKDQFPRHLPVDATIKSLSGRFQYPLMYGYSCVGRVVAGGNRTDPAWVGRRVFALHPHESHFAIHPQDLIPLPDGVTDEDAVFLPSLETAVNLVMDGRPVIGEHVMVWGLGIIGLLTTGLLARYPLNSLVCVDPVPLRREAATDLGADMALPGCENGFRADVVSNFSRSGGDAKADLIYELSGNPAALDTAMEWTGYTTRIVIGSWYGAKATTIDLGGTYHRNRIRVISSQVSTIDPRYSGRWTLQRRMQVTRQMLTILRPGRLITHRFDVQQAQSAYQLIADRPQDILQVVLTYPHAPH